MPHRHYDGRGKRGPSPAAQQVSARRKALLLSPLLSNIYLHYSFRFWKPGKSLKDAIKMSTIVTSPGAAA
jgi:hypothetical protein